MKRAKRRSEGIRSPEVVWALNLLWIGLGNYYAGGFKDPRWLLVGGLLYAATSLRWLKTHFIDPWIVGYVVMSAIGHVKVRRHNEKVLADQLRSGKRAVRSEARAMLYPGSSAEIAGSEQAAAQNSTEDGLKPLSTGTGVARPAEMCPSCAAPRDPLRFSCPQCAFMYDC